MLSVIGTYRIYTALRLHFTTNYDLTKYGGKVPGISIANVNKNPQRKCLMERLARRFTKPNDLVQYIVAQYAYADNSAIYDPMIAEENYILWGARRMSMTQHILDALYERDITALISGEPPEIFKLVLQGEMSVEVAVALNNLLNYNTKEYLGFSATVNRINKLAQFVKFDAPRVLEELEITQVLV